MASRARAASAVAAMVVGIWYFSFGKPNLQALRPVITRNYSVTEVSSRYTTGRLNESGEANTPASCIGLSIETTTSTAVLTREGATFKLDGVEIQLFGIRAANALESEVVAQHLVDNLDLIKAHGIQSISISLQGAGTGTASAFNSDGTLRDEYVQRLEYILDALAVRNMVAVVSYFYQARDQDLNDDNAVRAAVTNATNVLLPWRNVWLHTINEWYHSGFDRSILKTATGQEEIYGIIKGIDPQRITFVSDVSGANDGFIADTGQTASNGNVVVEYVRQDEYDAPGVFTTGDRSSAQQDAEETFNAGGYWFWHSAWHQKADVAGWPRYDEGGAGTMEDPGVSFIWNKMQALSQSCACTATSFLPIVTR